MRTCWVIVGLGLVACSSSDHGGSSSGTTSSSGGDGGACSATTCDPNLAAHFFDAAVVMTGKASSAAPCPAGMTSKAKQQTLGGVLGAPQRFTDEASLAAAFCEVGDAGASGAPAVDFAANDVIELDFDAETPTPPDLVSVGSNLWVSRQATQCGGPKPAGFAGFYVVPKGQVLNVESCTLTCFYGGACGPATP